MKTLHRILDIHTHHTPPLPHALVSVEPDAFHPVEGQYYSVGIHPWRTGAEVSEETWKSFEAACRHPQVKAIGECGIDLVKGGPLYRQMQVMKRQVELSEELGKPLVIHDVHAHDIIIGMRRDMKPVQNWMVHGFRGKPTVARMYADARIWISFGPMHNDASVPAVPAELMLAETDESDTTIYDVITSLSALRGHDLTDEIAASSRAFLGLDFEDAGESPVGATLEIDG